MAKINVEPWLNFSNTNGRGVCLKPNLEPIEVKPNYTYDGNGRLDFDIFLGSLEKAAQEHWGFRPALVAEAQHDSKFMSQITQAIVDRAILVIPNVLDMFDFYPESLTGEMIPCHIPVKMNGSGMVVSIWGCAKESGGYDLGNLVDDLEDSYREVLFLPAGYKVFSDSQRNVIRANGTKWIEKLKEEYRNHLAGKLGYSDEPEYKYKEIKTYSSPTLSIVFVQGKIANATFTLSGSIVISKNKLHIDVMGETALTGPPAVIAWNGTITLLKNGVPVDRQGLQWTGKGIWPNENKMKVPVGAVSFKLDPPNPADRWQLKFNAGYSYQEYGATAPAMPRNNQSISVDAKWVRFPDAIWKINREYEWLNPL